MMETFGVRRMMLGALASIGIGVALTPLMQQSWQLVVLWGFIVGSGVGVTVNVLAATIAARWFTERRGPVMGLLTSSAAAGQLLFLPVLAAVIATYGWRAMALVLVAIALALLFPVAKWMRERPEDVGLSSYWEAPGTASVPPYGLDWIATVPPTVRLTANAFGKDNTGLMFGWISASHQLGGAAAAYLGGVMRVDMGTYTQAFIISGVLCFVAAMLVMFIGRTPAKPASLAPAAAVHA